MIRKPSTHIMGTSKRIAPRYRVKTQLRTMAPMGMAKISIERPRKVSVRVPAPRGRRWSSPTRTARRVTLQVAHTMAV
jgi:hypothetical protein